MDLPGLSRDADVDPAEADHRPDLGNESAAGRVGGDLLQLKRPLVTVRPRCEPGQDPLQEVGRPHQREDLVGELSLRCRGEGSGREIHPAARGRRPSVCHEGSAARAPCLRHQLRQIHHQWHTGSWRRHHGHLGHPEPGYGADVSAVPRPAATSARLCRRIDGLPDNVARLWAADLSRFRRRRRRGDSGLRGHWPHAGPGHLA